MRARGPRRWPTPAARPARVLGAAYDTTGERNGDARVDPGARGDAGRLLLPGPRLALHLRQRRGRAAARPHRARSCSAGAVGAVPGRGRQRLRGQLPHGGARPGGRSPSTPTTPRRWTAGTSCAPGRARTGCRCTSSTSPSGDEAQERAERAPQRLALLARVTAELAETLDAAGGDRHGCRGWSCRRSPTGASSRVIDAGRPRCATSAPGTPTRPAAAVLERYAERAAGRHAGDRAASPGRCARARRRPSRDAARPVAGCCRPGEAQRAAAASWPPTRAVVLPLRARGRGRTVGLLTLFTAPDATPARTTTSPPRRRSPPGPGWPWTTPGCTPAAAARRGAAAQPAHRAARSPTTREIVVRYEPAARGGAGRRRLVRRLPAARRRDDAGHRRRRRPRHGGRGRDGPAARAAARHRHLQRRRPGRGAARAGHRRWPTLRMRHHGHRGRSPGSSRPTTSASRGITRMRWSNAGHPPPLVINPDGSVAELASWTGRPAARGGRRGDPRDESVVTLDRGATVLLYTDGLVERRGRRPRRRPGSGSATCWSSWPTVRCRSCCDEVLERLVPAGRRTTSRWSRSGCTGRTAPRPHEAGPTVVPPTVPPEPAT